MPYTWVEPDVYLKYRGVTIYYAYDELYNNPYHYNYSIDFAERDMFDIRDLPECKPGLTHKQILRAAIRNKSPLLIAQYKEAGAHLEAKTLPSKFKRRRPTHAQTPRKPIQSEPREAPAQR